MKSLETGYARDLFIEWARDKNNIVILPTKCQPNSLSKKLYDLWYEIVKDMPDDIKPAANIDINLELEVIFFIYLFIYLFICLFVCLFVCLLFVCLFVYILIYIIII